MTGEYRDRLGARTPRGWTRDLDESPLLYVMCTFIILAVSIALLLASFRLTGEPKHDVLVASVGTFVSWIFAMGLFLTMYAGDTSTLESRHRLEVGEVAAATLRYLAARGFDAREIDADTSSAHKMESGWAELLRGRRDHPEDAVPGIIRVLSVDGGSLFVVLRSTDGKETSLEIRDYPVRGNRAYDEALAGLDQELSAQGED